MYQRSIELITFEARLPHKELAHHDQHPDDLILLNILSYFDVVCVKIQPVLVPSRRGCSTVSVFLSFFRF